MLSSPTYEKALAASRDRRMTWWREARFGMFVHYGLYSQIGRQEWAMATENWKVEEYEKLAATFAPKEGCCREWASLAKQAGMKYMVLTTRHHEGFSLWESKANPYNSVNLGPKRDLVAEFVEACRAYDLRIGFYSSLMDWHHPDSWRCSFDSEARQRFNAYIEALNTELLSDYGKIDILWYDVPQPLESAEGWNSLEMNQRLRALQPDIIINDRSRLDEDFGTPEGHIEPREKDWEACMTFNDISWGYVDSERARPYSYSPQRIVKMLQTCCAKGGNLLLNIGPAPDGSVPGEAVDPLTRVGRWLQENGEAVYGKLEKSVNRPGEYWSPTFGSGWTCGTSRKGNTIYLWNWIWPRSCEIGAGCYFSKPRRVHLVKDGTPLEFEHDECRIILRNLPEEPQDSILGITVIAMEFDGDPEYHFASRYPQLHKGMVHGGKVEMIGGGVDSAT
jgi:alpha-L-fucosidase